MGDDQMELENLEAEEDVSEEEVPEEESEDSSEPIKPAKTSSRKSSSRRRSTKRELSDDSEEEVKSVTSEAAGPTVEARAPLEVSQIRVNVRSLWPARLIVRGTPSDEVYDWPNAGALVSVNSVDVGFLMSKNKTGEQGCCGGGPRNYFELA